MKKLISAIWIVAFTLCVSAENKPERLEWLKDAGLGLFIHWSVDSQIGTVISHSLVGADEAFCEYFFNELPKTFNPTRFDADEWARLAKVAGFQYVVFTTKHHSGFCMFDTETTEFNIMNTPYGKDITKEVVDAFRAQGLEIGFYFSPDDFSELYRQGTLISRRRPEALPINNPELMELNKAQIRELFSNYGQIDVLFIDGPKEAQGGGLTELVWELQPDCLITRGAISTPEISPSTGQELPESLKTEPWEACFTMGTSWQYKPTNESYRDGTEWIHTLIETRAKGGTMLLNIGPKPNGEIPIEQESILIEMGTWMAINREAIYDVRPWSVIQEKDVWFTQSKSGDAVYAFVMDTDWEYGTERTIKLKSLKATDDTVISVLGQNDLVLEYQPDVIPQTRWEAGRNTLNITAMRAQRIYNDRTWPNPVVLKITGAETADE